MTVLQSVFLLALISAAQGQSLTSSEPVVNRAGQSVTLSCKVEGLPLEWLHWIRQKSGKGLEWIGRIDSGTGTIFSQSLQGQFSITKDTSQNVVYLEVRSLKAEDSAVYYCARGLYGRSFDYWGRGTDVTVTSGTTVSPTLFPLVQCASENNNKVTLGCLAQDFSPKSLQFQWAGGTKTPDSVQYIFGENDKYTGVSVVQVLRSDADSLPYNCSITHPGGSKTVQVKLPSPSPPIVTPDRTPNKGEPKVMVHILPEEDIQKISDVSLVCLVSSSTQQDYNIAWSEDAEQGTGNYNDGITSPPQKTNNAYFVTSVYTIKKEKWNQGNYVVTCNVWPAGNNKTITSRGVSKSLDCPQDPKQNYITSEYLSCTDASPEEDEFSSLWSTTSSFIFLFIFTLLYNMIFSLVKMKRQ